VPHLHQALLAIYRAECSVLHYGVALTVVEQDLLRWIAAGRTSEEIAALRGRSPSTVRNQLSSMFKKLGAGNRAEAVRLAHGVLHNVR
jgi:DNA-binding CsgD family transcriptional regulator